MHNIYSSLKHLLLHFPVIKYKTRDAKIYHPDNTSPLHLQLPAGKAHHKGSAFLPSLLPMGMGPSPINLSQQQPGTHQFGLSHRSKTRDIRQGNLPLYQQSSSQPVLMEIMFSCKCHMDPNPAPGRQSRCASSVSCPWHAAKGTLSTLSHTTWHP